MILGRRSVLLVRSRIGITSYLDRGEKGARSESCKFMAIHDETCEIENVVQTLASSWWDRYREAPINFKPMSLRVSRACAVDGCVRVWVRLAAPVEAGFSRPGPCAPHTAPAASGSRRVLRSPAYAASGFSGARQIEHPGSQFLGGFSGGLLSCLKITQGLGGQVSVAHAPGV